MNLLWLLVIPVGFVLYLVFRVVFAAVRFEIVKRTVPLPSRKWYSMISRILRGESDTEEERKPDMLWSGINFGGRPTIMVSNPDLIKDVLNLPKDPALYHVVEWFLGDGLVTAEGEIWKFYRRTITPLFHFGVLKDMVPTMKNRIRIWMDDIHLHQGKQYPAFELFEYLTCAIIIDLAFGQNFDVDWMHPKFKQLGDSIGPLMLGYLVAGDVSRHIPTRFMIGYNKLEKDIRTKIKQRIDEVRSRMNTNETNEPENLMTMLINIQKQDKTVTDDQIIDHCLTFLFAGHETVATTSCWMMYYMGKFPEYQQKVADEAESVGDITVENMSKLVLTKNFMNETLRLRPIMKGASRIADRDIVIGGNKIPAGTSLVANFWTNHIDPTIWKSPMEFSPERWSDESVNNRHAFSYCPFSAGPRNCIGMRFAQQEATLILSSLMKEFVVETNIKGDIKPAPGGVPKPKGLILSFTPRK
eukprot:TRINITY_DN54_c0_g2_i1.p1 TRINITY_DN54_c0_g2~~TRINITY_DN54_c0_g2_i1.p1  ORF type:complete len:471 (+),score=109.23 TRINITY_DN54_c0_g2_i1:34-1446(+)